MKEKKKRNKNNSSGTHWEKISREKEKEINLSLFLPTQPFLAFLKIIWTIKGKKQLIGLV